MGWLGYWFGAGVARTVFGEDKPDGSRAAPEPVRHDTEETIRADEKRFAEDEKRLDAEDDKRHDAEDAAAKRHR
jgi:hypothetical protein